MIGSTISHYEIIEKLGEGGMGVVYKARDTQLNRFVALKLLPAEKIGDPDRLQRFTQEARTASSLNHPNIITIHDIGSAGATPFIVMEYVNGKTLDQLIPRKGMRLSEVLKISTQIADALAAAAAAGVIHRDIKPGNVMVAEGGGHSGLVKVLDFGLAKAEARAASAEERTATIIGDAERPRTRAGIVMGTISYMSPEQAEGKQLDPRSDIFSFGALLYEMTTGQRAFRGDTTMSTLSSILRDDPVRAGQLAADVPRDLEKIIQRCLRKDPERRFQHMSDVRVALLELKEESESGNVPFVVEMPARKQRRRWMFVAAGVLLAAAGVAIGLRIHGSLPTAPVALRTFPLTSYSGPQGPPAFSPDGNQVAFSWTGDQGDTMHLYVKLIGNDTPLRLTSDSHPDSMPAWAPDGKSIAFFRHLETGNVIYQISPIGGAERRIAEVAASPGGRPSWSRDGKSLVVSGPEAPGKPSRLFVVGLDTGEKRLLSFGQPVDESSPALSPDSRRLVFTRITGSVASTLFVVDLDERLQPKGTPRQLNTPPGFNADSAWTADSRNIVFNNNHGTLWIVPASGDAPARRLPVETYGVSSPAISSQGNRMALLRRFRETKIWSFPIAGPGNVGEPAAIAGSTRVDRILEGSFSPDGRKVAFESDRSGGAMAVWMANADGTNPTFLAGAQGFLSGSPSWSPDGRWIALDSRHDGNAEIYVVSAERGALRRLTNHPADDILPCWSHNGKWIYFTSNRSGKFEIYKAPVDGGNPVQLTHQTGWAPQESSDGKFVYYTRALPTSISLTSAAKSPLFRIPVNGGEETQVANWVVERSWAVTPQGIWFMFPSGPGAELRFLDTATGKLRTAARISKRLETGLALSPDGRTMLYNQSDHTGSEILLVENFR